MSSLTPVCRQNALILAVSWTMLCLFSACDPIEIEPDGFEYPLKLTSTQAQSVTILQWTEATVSTFEEYVLVRSTEPINDTPEPEIGGAAVIVDRIDQRTVTTFEDVNVPITDTVYYKVYARIADRFLMSQTLVVDRDLNTFLYRSDGLAADIEHGLLYGVDRAIGIIYVYDYLNKEVVKTNAFNGSSQITIRLDSDVNELAIGDLSSVTILDATTLNQKVQFFPGIFHDLQFANGWIYLQQGNFPYNYALYTRSNGSFKDAISALSTDWRKSFVIVDPSDLNRATIFDFGVQGIARYVQVGSDLQLDLLNQETRPGNFVVAARHPLRNEFVCTNAGVVVDGNLEQVALLSGGTQSFSLYAYSPDGTRLYALAQQQTQSLRTYDVENAYKLIRSDNLSNQSSPIYLFSDEVGARLVSMVFLNNGTVSLITTIAHP